jgi:hypothetical protein
MSIIHSHDESQGGVLAPGPQEGDDVPRARRAADLKKLSDDTADFFCNAVGTTFGPLANVSVEMRAAPAGVMGGEGEL